MLKTFTRGGQVTMHNVRMIRQVLSVTTLLTLFVGVIGLGTKTWFDYPPYERSAAISYFWASFKINLPFVENKNKVRMTQHYTFENGKRDIVYSKDIANDPWHQALAQHVTNQAMENLWIGLWFMGGVFIILCGLWVWRGKANKLKEVISGSEVVEPKALQNILEKEQMASPFKLGGISLRLNSETQHILFCGTTGTGKSNCFNQLFPQIRESKQKAIIVDTTGEFVRYFYRHGKDILINPFDVRSMNWNPWGECEHPYHYDELSSGFIPQTGNDRFWADNARTILTEALIYLAKKGDNGVEQLHHLLLTESLHELYKALKDTPASSLLDPAGDRTAMSIRSHLTPNLKFLRYLPKDKPVFSVRNWVQQAGKQQNDDSWLFIASTPGQRETLKPLITGLMSIAFNSLMGIRPDPDRRIWFAVDELISLNKQDILPKALAESRKFGGCIVAGIQNIPQLQDLYGYAETKSITSLFNTKLVFRNGDPETAKYMSQLLGEQEVIEKVEGLSYGENSIRDGVTLNEQKHMKPIVNSSDIMALDDLEAYVKLAGNLPIARLKFDYTVLQSLSPAFVSQYRVQDSAME